MPALHTPPSTVRTRDGLDLALRHWPCAAPARGRLLIVHGLGEHVGRYAHVAAHLNARGWDVVGYDQRGHGASPGKRGAVAAGDDLLDDLGRVFDAVRPDGVPFVLLGHSMGALIAAQLVAEDRRPVEALVLSSPPIDAGLGPAQRLQLRVGLALVPDLAMSNQLDATRISHDPAVVRAYQDDPLVHDRVTARLVQSLVVGGAVVLARAPRWPVPTLLMWAGDDRLVKPAGSEAFAAAAPRAMVTTQRFDGLWHEIMNELDATPVFATLDGWLDPRRAPA